LLLTRIPLIHTSRQQNNQKEKIWSAMTAEEKWAYQEDITAREKEGSNRLDFRLTR
jgi:hypothetical protein